MIPFFHIVWPIFVVIIGARLRFDEHHDTEKVGIAVLLLGIFANGYYVVRALVDPAARVYLLMPVVSIFAVQLTKWSITSRS